jgi:CHAT domain-containing protein
MLVGKRPAGASLREAQLQMVSAKRPPFYWAAFQLHGDWR